MILLLIFCSGKPIPTSAQDCLKETGKEQTGDIPSPPSRRELGQEGAHSMAQLPSLWHGWPGAYSSRRVPPHPPGYPPPPARPSPAPPRVGPSPRRCGAVHGGSAPAPASPVEPADGAAAAPAVPQQHPRLRCGAAGGRVPQGGRHHPAGAAGPGKR